MAQQGLAGGGATYNAITGQWELPQMQFPNSPVAATNVLPDLSGNQLLPQSAPSLANSQSSPGGGFNFGTFGKIGQGLTGLAGLYNAINQRKNQKSQLSLSRDNFDLQRSNLIADVNRRNDLARQLGGVQQDTAAIPNRTF